MALSIATLSTMTAAAVGPLEKLDNAARTDSPSLLSLCTTAELLTDMQDSVKAFRSDYAAALADSAAKRALDPVIKQWGITIGSNSTDPYTILDDMTDYFHAYDLPAQGTLTMDTEPSDGDTITIGTITYRFKTTLATAEDILTGDGLSAVQARLVGVVNGSGVSAGVDYYAGTTTPHTTVLAYDFSSNDAVFEARTNGTAGNSTVTTETFTAGTNVWDAATLGTTQAGREELSVQSRVFSFGAVAANSANAGTGTIRRLTVGPDGLDIESCTPQTVTVICTKDSGSGATKYRETFEIRSAAAFRDRSDVLGAGGSPTQLLPMVPNTKYVPNAGFASLTPTPAADGASVTAITDWEIVSGTLTAGYGDEFTEIYRDHTTTGDGHSLIADADFKIRSRARGFTTGKAYDVCIAILRESSADGTFTFRVGAILISVDVSTLTNDVWHRAYATLDETLYYENFNEENSDVAAGEPDGIRAIVQLASNTTGTVRFGDICVEEMTTHDALHYSGDGPGNSSSPIRFQADDEYTFGDTCTEAIINKWVQRGYRRHLPHVASSPTISEPTVS